MDKKLAKLVSQILISEVVPRQIRYGVDIPHGQAGQIARAEFDGIITREETRMILDELFKMVKENGT